VKSVGFFGILGAGNSGNDAQFESVLNYLKTEHPGVAFDAMCEGPRRMREVYGIDAVPMHYRLAAEPETWEGRSNQGTATTRKRPSPVKVFRLALELGIDTMRMANWVRRHDVVIMPGAGAFETTLLVRPWTTPYANFIVSLAGRIFRTKVAYVSVGASVINQPVTRFLFISAAKLAFYRSYRDEFSRAALGRQGVDTAADHVYADLAFGIPPAADTPGDSSIVGVGVMAYYGTNDDRAQSKILHEAYKLKLKSFIQKLVDSGRQVRLFVGDTNGSDESIAQELLADFRAEHPDLDPTWVSAEQSDSFTELMHAMSPVGFVVATRYHNVLCALKLAKLTVAAGYSPKHAVLMTSMGMGDYCQDIAALDVDLLIKQLDDMGGRSAELRQSMKEHHAAAAKLVAEQFAEISRVLLPGSR
jgi:polysaccharide pyruvyl transferase WcaK-like protein